MRRCPNCGAQIADDSRFCSECGKEITQGNVCPHCGASVGEGDAFCQNCGKSLNEAPSSEPITYEEEQSKSRFKKYLPYIIGAVLLLAIIGYFSSKDSGVNNEDSTAIDSIAADSVVTNEVTPISKEKLESILTQLIGDMDADLVLKKANKLFTEEFKTYYNRACEKADREHQERPRLWWQFSDSDPETFTVDKMEMTDNSKAKAIVKLSSELYEGRFEVLLNSEKGDWLIDKITELGVENVQTYEANEDVEYGSVDSEYSKYIGKWSNYIVSQGQRVKVYTAIIHNDLTAEWITYLPDGSVNASMSFRQCVFQDGYVYFTDIGDTSIKGTPRFRLGSSGLQTADGENMVKE